VRNAQTDAYDKCYVVEMPAQARPYIGGNILLDLLTETEAQTLLAAAAIVDFQSGDILLDTNKTIKYVYFPIDMMVSTTTLMRDGFEVEVGSIGCEGMSGAQVFLGVDHVPGKTICQVSGSAARLPAHTFLEHMERSAASSKSLRRYIQAVTNFLEISIACNALHTVSPRCARWLLITHDRVRRDDFGLTQEFVANMLGTRRATVNAVAQNLQDKGAIRYARGRVQILDRALLEGASCECYKLGIDRYNELLSQAAFTHTNGSPSVSRF